MNAAIAEAINRIWRSDPIITEKRRAATIIPIVVIDWLKPKTFPCSVCGELSEIRDKLLAQVIDAKPATAAIRTQTARRGRVNERTKAQRKKPRRGYFIRG